MGEIGHRSVARLLLVWGGSFAARSFSMPPVVKDLAERTTVLVLFNQNVLCGIEFVARFRPQTFGSSPVAPLPVVRIVKVGLQPVVRIHQIRDDSTDWLVGRQSRIAVHGGPHGENRIRQLIHCHLDGGRWLGFRSPR